ncbi:hypothetical protein TNCV_2614021 [Trichonephila clavipes]|nr:hypothetical protein TNCV_2614021 [Trichonephila clavipes]
MRAFGDGPRNFEPWSSDVDGTPSPNYHTTPTGGCFSSQQIERASLPYTAGLLKWYWARTHDMPAMIRYLDHFATAAISLEREVLT